MSSDSDARRDARITSLRFELGFTAEEVGSLESTSERNIYNVVKRVAGSAKPTLTRLPLHTGVRCLMAMVFFKYDAVALAKALKTTPEAVNEAVERAKAQIYAPRRKNP